MYILSASTFRDSLTALLKRTDNGYGSCCIDICAELDGKSFTDIFEMSFLVREIGNARVIKLRIQNSLQNLSKADGFRLILFCKQDVEEIVLLKVYPKKGKLRKDDCSKEEYKQLLKTLTEEKKKNLLVKHNPKAELAAIA